MPMKSTVIVVIEGGQVRDIVSPDPELFREVNFLTVDYDTDGGDAADQYEIMQSSGDYAKAYAHWHGVTRATIDYKSLEKDMLER